MNANALKTAWKLLVHGLGGLDATASCVRVARSQVAAYGDIHNPERFAPVDVVAAAEEVLGDCPVTRALAAAQGFALVPVDPPGEGELAALLARFGRDEGDIFALALPYLQGAPIPEAQRERLLADCRDAIAALHGFEAFLAPRDEAGRH